MSKKRNSGRLILELILGAGFSVLAFMAIATTISGTQTRVNRQLYEESLSAHLRYEIDRIHHLDEGQLVRTTKQKDFSIETKREGANLYRVRISHQKKQVVDVEVVRP